MIIVIDRLESILKWLRTLHWHLLPHNIQGDRLHWSTHVSTKALCRIGDLAQSRKPRAQRIDRLASGQKDRHRAQQVISHCHSIGLVLTGHEPNAFHCCILFCVNKLSVCLLLRYCILLIQTSHWPYLNPGKVSGKGQAGHWLGVTHLCTASTTAVARWTTRDPPTLSFYLTFVIMQHWLYSARLDGKGRPTHEPERRSMRAKARWRQVQPTLSSLMGVQRAFCTSVQLPSKGL